MTHATGVLAHFRTATHPDQGVTGSAADISETDLIALVGPENAAALSREMTPAERASLKAFGAEVRATSDGDFAREWGIRDLGLVGEIRDLFARSEA